MNNDFNRLADFCEAALNGWADSPSPLTELLTPVHYSVLGEGKRLRGVLSLAAAEILSINKESLVDVVIAIEIVHAASLVHDDLPSMDNAQLRRGKLTSHKKFGEGTALLAGDAMIAEAFRVIASSQTIPCAAKIKISNMLSTAIVKLCEGQLLDIRSGSAQIHSEEQDCFLESDLYARHRLKTGALIEAALIAPTSFLIEDLFAVYQPILSAYADSLGLLFQITDDILDATATKEALGKKPNADADSGTPNFVSVYGLNKARLLATEFQQKAKASLNNLGVEADFLRDLSELVRDRKR